MTGAIGWNAQTGYTDTMQILQAEKTAYKRVRRGTNRAGILGMIALILLCGFLTGCSGGTLAKGGDIYPYEVHRGENGTLKVLLDGSRTPDWQWVVDAGDEYYGVYRQGDEKEGKVTFLIRPVKLCDGAVLVIRRRAKKSDKPCAVLKLMLSIDSNKSGNGLVANLVECTQSEPGAMVLLGRDTGAPLRYYRKETGQLVLTLKNFPDWKLQVENVADQGSGSGKKDQSEQPESRDEEDAKGEEITLQPSSEEESIEPQYDEKPERGSWRIEGSEVEAAAKADTEEANTEEANAEGANIEQDGSFEEAAGALDEISQEEILDMLELSDDRSLWLGGAQNDQGLSWYQDPACHLRRGLCGISQDEATMLITFEPGTPGSSDIFLESEEASYRLYMRVLVDENGIIQVRKAEYTKIHGDAEEDEDPGASGDSGDPKEEENAGDGEA
ncbi:MAG: hypothetical protein K6E18_00565 [Lachnospiraceae bacterium]|nr:hypothetical protein [Lachnospiraceae bacterium]